MSAPAAQLAVVREGIACADVTDRETWEREFAQVTQPHFPQAWAYGEGKRGEWELAQLSFTEEGRVVALCQVLSKHVLGWAWVSRINRGPLFTRPASPGTQLEVLLALRRRWRLGRRGLLLIAPSLAQGTENDALLHAAGFTRRRQGGWGSASIELEAPLEVIRARLSSKWRNHLKQSLRAGLTTSVSHDSSSIDWLLERHASNMASKRFAGPSPGFVKRMAASTPSDFRVFQAHRAGTACCAILVARVGAQAETFLSWTGEEGRRICAHHFLLWHIIEQLKSESCRALDLGGYTTHDRYGAYKRAMRGREYRLAGEWMAL